MFERYAIYYTFTGTMADKGAAWLGWDITNARQVPHPQLKAVDLAKITERPRKYGLHATIKPPFQLAAGYGQDRLMEEFSQVCANMRAINMGHLELTQIGRFLALCAPQGASAVLPLAAHVVEELDHFRAPPSAADIARRNPARLTPEQMHNLQTWGYPHVMQQFRFHVTLSGPIKQAELPNTKQAATDYFAPVLPRPFVLDALTLAGQDQTGMFRSIARMNLR